MLSHYVSNYDNKEAEKIYVQWRKEFLECFGKDAVQFPNFHLGSSTPLKIVQNMGNVTWFWALLFEMKHSVYKQFNYRSNKKQLELRAAQREMALKSIFCQFPEARSDVIVHLQFVC